MKQRLAKYVRDRLRSGLSMLEVIVAISILFLGSSFVMSMFITGANTVNQTEETTRLNALAQSKMAEIMAVRYDLLGQNPPTIAPPGPVGAGPSMNGISQPFLNPDAPYAPSGYSWVYVGTPGPAPPLPSTATTTLIQLTVTAPSGKTRVWTSLRTSDPRDLGERLYFSYGCVGCHELDEVGANGKIGPPHTHLGDIAGNREPPLTAVQYIEESVRTPAAYIVPGFQPFMAGLPLDSMPPTDLNVLTSWLINTTTSPPPPPPPAPAPGPAPLAPGAPGPPSPGPHSWCSSPFTGLCGNQEDY